MYRDHKIGLVIPAHNEERLIRPTLEHVPELVDRVWVIDDGSQDQTAAVVSEIAGTDSRIELLSHSVAEGPGAAIISGYQAALAADMEIVVVVGGDYQMDLSEVTGFLDPIIDDQVDYTKGNRFMMGGNAFEDMPAIRLFGNTLISFMTKIASGYYKVFDVVDGYTAISRRALELVPWQKAWPKYGYPMDFLIQLNTYGCRVRDIPRRAIYLEGERQSQIKGLRYAVSVSPMIIRGFFRRLFVRYLLRDFHPVIFFYLLGLLLLPLGGILGVRLLWIRLFVDGGGITPLTGILCALFMILGLQSLLFAMLFDMQESQ